MKSIGIHQKLAPLKPRYPHPCQCCQFLGYYGAEDLYRCSTEKTYIARLGSDPKNYTTSSLGIKSPKFAIAAALAQELDGPIGEYEEPEQRYRKPTSHSLFLMQSGPFDVFFNTLHGTVELVCPNVKYPKNYIIAITSKPTPNNQSEIVKASYDFLVENGFIEPVKSDPSVGPSEWQ